MVSIKIEVNTSKGADIRRVRLQDLDQDSKSDFETVTNFVKRSFPKISTFVLKYKDDEGDLVTIASETEFHEALRVAELAKRCLKMYLVEQPIVQTIKPPTAVKRLDSAPTVSDPLQVDIQLLGTTGSVVVSKGSVDLTELRLRAVDVFPDLKAQEFSLKYLDDEGDAVTMTELEELQDALQLVKDGHPLDLIVVINPGGVQTTLVNGSACSQKDRSRRKCKKKKKAKRKNNGKILPGMT